MLITTVEKLLEVLILEDGLFTLLEIYFLVAVTFLPTIFVQFCCSEQILASF